MVKHFKIEPLRMENFIKVNDLKRITNPIFFDSNNNPTAEGLLSNQIFGITKDDRANTFGYIALGKNETFIHPLFYKIWTKMDSRIRECVHGTKTFSISKEGELVEDENGSSGIKFLEKNIDKIIIKRTDSSKRDDNIKFISDYKDRMFISNMIVIPAYYRDVDTSGAYVGVGDINKIYNSLIIASKSLSESNDYGLNLSDTIRGRIEEILVQLYEYFTKGLFNGQPVTGIAGKFGILRRANLSKTTDYSARIVLSAPKLAVESMEDMITDLDHSAVPLASVVANFYPYMIFYIRRFFENTFAGTDGAKTAISVDKKTNKMTTTAINVPSYQTIFSDDVIKEELDRFSHGFANRFRKIEFPTSSGVAHLVFSGYSMTEEDYTKAMKDKVGNLPIIERAMTWCDLIYIAAVEVTRDKCVLITRYPMDSYFNQFPTKVNVSSTKITEPMIVNGKFYRFYPRIREEDIGKNTSNLFTDTLKICNAYLPSIGGDYDGDQVSCKSVYSIEANAELAKQIDSKSHYISLGAENAMMSSNEAIQSLFNLTLILPDDVSKIQDPVF